MEISISITFDILHKLTKLMPIKILRGNRKTLALYVLPDASVCVKAPLRILDTEISSFIEKHRDWIDKRIAQVALKKVSQKQYHDGEKFLYLGKTYTLKVGNYSTIKLDNELMLFPKVALFRIEKELSAWYIKQAKTVIKDQLEKCAFEMKVTYGSLMYSDTKSKWGTCTAENNLQFSWRLIMAPLLVIRYVVIHELAHTIEKNHSQRFWSQVRSYNPSYRQHIKWLKDYGNTLVI